MDEQGKCGRPGEDAVADVVRGFFHGFMAGRLDRQYPKWRNQPDARLVRALAMESYPRMAATFCHIAFPILLGSRFDSFEKAQEDLARHRFSDRTPVRLLMRYACGSRERFQVMEETYREEMAALLDGRLDASMERTGTYYRKAVMDSHEAGFNWPADA